MREEGKNSGGRLGAKGVTFLATLPDIQTAIKVSGGGGMRVQLDIPESEMPAAVGLIALRDKVLRVTVFEDGADEQRSKSGRSRIVSD